MKKDSSEQQQRVLRKLVRLHKPFLAAMSHQWNPELAVGAKSALISRRSAQIRTGKVTPTSNKESRTENTNLISFVDSIENTDSQPESRKYNSTQQLTSEETVDAEEKLKKPRKKRISRALFRHDKIDYIKPKKQELLQNSFSINFKKLVDKSKDIYSKLDEDEELRDNKTEEIMKNEMKVSIPIKCPQSLKKSKNLNNQSSVNKKLHTSTLKTILDMPSLDLTTTQIDINVNKNNCNKNEYIQKQLKNNDPVSLPTKNMKTKTNENKRTLRKSEKNKDEPKKTTNNEICHIETKTPQTLHYPFYGCMKQNTIAQENAQKQKTVEDRLNSIVNTEKDNRSIPPYFPHNFYPLPSPYFFPYHMQNPVSKFSQIPQFNCNNYYSLPSFPNAGSKYELNNVFPGRSTIRSLSKTEQHKFRSKITEISSLQEEPTQKNKNFEIKQSQNYPNEQIKNLEQQIVKNLSRRKQKLNEEIKQNFRNLQMSVSKTTEQDTNSKKNEKQTQNLETKKQDFKSQIYVVQNIHHRKQNISLENEEKDFRLERKRPGSSISSEINIKNPRPTANTTLNKNNSSILINNELHHSNLATIQSNKISNCVNPIAESQKSVIISPNLQENQSVISSTSCSVITKVPSRNINKHSIDNILSLKCSTEKGLKSEKIRILNVENIPIHDHRYLNINQNKFPIKQNVKTKVTEDSTKQKKIDPSIKKNEKQETETMNNKKFTCDTRPMPKLMKADEYFLRLNTQNNNKTVNVPKETNDKQLNSTTPLNLSLKKSDQENNNQNRQSIIVENIFNNGPQQLIKSLIENEKYDMEVSFVKTDEEYEEYLKLLKEKNATRPYLFYKFVTEIQKQNKKPMFDLITFFCLLKKGKLINYKNLYNQFHEKK